MLVSSHVLRVSALFVLAGAASAGDWLTFGGDSQRTGWARNETILTKQNVGRLKLEWKAKLGNTPRELNSLTVPVVIINLPMHRGFKDIAIVAGSSEKIWALDADNGKVLWDKQFTIEGAPKNPNGGWLCPFVLNATPVIDRASKTVYVLAGDGKLHGLNVFNGEDRIPPFQLTPAFAKTWSLNLVGDTLYTTTSQGCNGVRSAVYAVNLKDPEKKVSSFVASPTGGAGIWGRAGAAVTSSGMVVAETGDGPYDAAAGKYSDTFLGLSAGDLKLADYYTPANRSFITKKDLDMGCMSPIVFKYKGRELIAGAGKEGVIYLLDAKSLGGSDHRTPVFRSPLYTNEEVDYAGRGFWGAMASWVDAKGDTWLFAPAWGPQAGGSPEFPVKHGDAPEGSIMAFRIGEKDGKPTLAPAWRSRDMSVPEPPIIANGVLFALANAENTRQVDTAGRMYTSKERADTPSGNAILYAYDAETGKELFSSGKTIPGFTHFSGLAISEGRVYVVTHDSTVYAFGLGGEE
jgi:outer membrane protein assembly factor BamB